MQQGIAKGDVLQRLAGIAFIVGAIVTGVFNILLPRAGDPTDVRAAIQTIADNNGGFWEVDHLLLAVGIWALMIGAVGVYRSIPTGGGAAWVRLGFYGVIVGTTLWTVLFALALTGGEVVEQWEAATGADKATWFLVVSSLHYTAMRLMGMTIIVYWLALVFVGIGMVLSTVYAKWLGWAPIVLGAATVAVVGVPQALTDPSQAFDILFAILSTLTLVWALVLGIWITRRAW